MSNQYLSRTTILSLVAAHQEAQTRLSAVKAAPTGSEWQALGRPQTPGSVAADHAAASAHAAWVAVLREDWQAWEHPARYASIAARQTARAESALAVAERESADAQDEIADALDAAPCGRQPGDGRVFIRRWGGWPQDDSRTVQACVDGLPVVTVQFGWDMDAQADAVAAGLDEPAFTRACRLVAVRLHDHDEEVAIREAQRAASRMANAAYEVLLDEAAAAILAGALPAAWEIEDGQLGGYIATAPEYYTSSGGYRYSTGSGPRVSCAGALRRAGISPGVNAADTLREYLRERADEQPQARPRLTARARSMPASDRRRALASEVAL